LRFQLARHTCCSVKGRFAWSVRWQAKDPNLRAAKRRGDMSEFLTDLKEIKARARKEMEQGAVTDNYKADRNAVIKVLNQILATELVCVLRYRRHYYMAAGLNSEAVKEEFLQHADQEQQHADWVATRITQLNGEPNFNPEGLASRSHSEYAEGSDLVSMIKEDLFAERIAIETYSEIVRWIGDKDPTTRRGIEDILKVEEEHAEDLKTLLQRAA
jgi:bacterioferritin